MASCARSASRSRSWANIEDHESADAVYLRMCDEAIRRAARELKDGWNQVS
jgi:hypothetical protein